MSEPIKKNLEPDHLFLSGEDVERLLNDNSSDSRIAVMEKVSDSYVTQSFHESELLYAEQIFRLLVKDTEMRVRKALADKLKQADHIPRDILLELTKDHETIAIPIIERSQLLSDADLIRIVESSREVGKIEAVARRDKVSERVSTALIKTHYPQVIKTLLENKGSKIANRDYETILHEHGKDEYITQAMAHRQQLPMPVVEKLIHQVSDAVVKQLQDLYQIDLKEAKEQTREAMTLQIVPLTSSDAEIEETIKQMIAFDRLTSSIVLSSLCQGHIRFFEIALARLANIPKANARKLIRDRGMLGFEALYEKTEMPESTYEAVRLLLAEVLDKETTDLQPGSALYANALIEGMLYKAGDREVENLSYIIALVRQSIQH